MRRVSHAEAERFDAFLDRLVAVPDATAATEAEPALAETARRVHRLGDGVVPDAAFVVRLETALLAAPPVAADRPRTVRPGGTDGRAVGGAAARTAHVPRWTTFRAAAVQIAASAALVAALGGAAVVLRPRWEPRPVSAPAPPSGEFAPGVRVEPLARATGVELPRGPTDGLLNLRTYPPGFAGQAVPIDGINLLRVVSGAIVLAADAPIDATRAALGALQPSALDAPGKEVRLVAGDQAVVPLDAGYRLRNDGEELATVLELALDGDVGTGGGAPGASVVGLSAHGQSVPLPSPADLALARVTLAPGTSLPPEVAPGLFMAYVESGTLEAALFQPPAPATPIGFATFRAGQGAPVGDIAQVLPGGFRNAGDEPLVLLLVTITPTADVAGRS